MLGKKSPIEAGSHVVKGYNSELKLTSQELKVYRRLIFKKSALEEISFPNFEIWKFDVVIGIKSAVNLL